MKAQIHPTFDSKAVATCACGAEFVVGSIVSKIAVEICSNCHPFYTGTDKVLDTAGRVEKFKNRQAASDKKKSEKKSK